MLVVSMLLQRFLDVKGLEAGHWKEGATMSIHLPFPFPFRSQAKRAQGNVFLLFPREEWISIWLGMGMPLRIVEYQ